MKKRKNSLKGLILLVVLLSAIIVYFVLKITKDNFELLVRVYSDNKPQNNTLVIINNKKWRTAPDGLVKASIKAKEGNQIIIQTKNDGFKDTQDTVQIDHDRLLLGHTNKIIHLIKQ